MNSFNKTLWPKSRNELNYRSHQRFFKTNMRGVNVKIFTNVSMCKKKVLQVFLWWRNSFFHLISSSNNLFSLQRTYTFWSMTEAFDVKVSELCFAFVTYVLRLNISLSCLELTVFPRKWFTIRDVKFSGRKSISNSRLWHDIIQIQLSSNQYQIKNVPNISISSNCQLEIK